MLRMPSNKEVCQADLSAKQDLKCFRLIYIARQCTIHQLRKKYFEQVSLYGGFVTYP